jgi:hypothetical protein
MDNEESGNASLASSDVVEEDTVIKVDVVMAEEAGVELDAPSNNFDSLAIRAMKSGSHGFEWSNSDFCSSAVNLKSVTIFAMFVHDEHFDVDNIDPSTIYKSTEDFEKVNSLPELEQEYIIVERMEFLRNEHLMSKVL